MEGRLMLSADGLNLSQYPSSGVNLTWSSGQSSFNAVPTAMVIQPAPTATEPIEGGYINLNSDVVTNQWHLLNVGQAGQDLFGVVGQDVNVVPVWKFGNPDVGQISSGVTRAVLDYASNGDVSGLRFNKVDSYDSTGLQPVVIVLSTNDGSLAPMIRPIVAGPPESSPAPGEGGSIPIHAIFADFRKDSNLASGGKSISSPATESSLESLASMRRASSSDNAITGEWARAMVFEIAGGEPSARDSHLLGDQPATTSSTDDKLEHSEPVSSIETLQQNEQFASRHSAGPANDAFFNDQNQLPTGQSDGQITAVSMKFPRGSHRTTGSMTPAQIGQFAADWSAESTSPDPTTTAAAAVFDQLAESNAAVIESSVDSKSWMRSIGASPLLMVLALERIAALNSRRAPRESRNVAAKKPLRLRG
jgi:hypothetical protein